eukprot:15448955-Alexandrium_andersonii.AAC.1
MPTPPTGFVGEQAGWGLPRPPGSVRPPRLLRFPRAGCAGKWGPAAALLPARRGWVAAGLRRPTGHGLGPPHLDA